MDSEPRMVKVQHFNENLEKSLERLGHRVQEIQKARETQKLPEREVLKQSIQSLAEAASSPPMPPPHSVTPPPPAVTQPQANIFPTYLEGDSADTRAKQEVADLVALTFQAGLEKALHEAKKHNPFVEDAFHDALVDKLLPELKSRGLLK